MAWREGMKVVHRAQRAWGVGVVVQVADEGRRLAVRFAGREGVTVVSGRDPALAEVPRETPLDGAPAGGPIDALAQGSAGPAAAFRLRTRVVRLEALRRADSLGALLSSRVHVLPHQVGAAGRVLSDRIPRFVLADEVGLGKTVEAGLVFAGLRQLGIAERVLVVVPEHLAFQWLAELFHKFNALFTLLGPERVASLGGAEAALARSPHAIVSFESLLADPDLARAAAALPLDLVVVDEAHHLAGDPLHERVAPLCRASFGLLLLTATPVRLDPSEYFRLLSLVEPLPSRSLDAFLERLERHEAYADVARALLAGGDPEEARARLRALAPEDGFLSAPRGREELLAHLSDRHGLSARLVRNRRVKVGAFTARVPRRRDVPEGGKPEALVRLCADLARRGEKVLAFGHDLDALRALQAGLARAGLEAL
ncbi:MAG TPA: SNF2-related protein, partial [Anaeromyxobacteraceae bacterium]|nr:SNF2-related protein [Anaeromyxobacteraceae bacterium]